ncbi:hypothetical protein KGF57_000698 [Candida theae]|uniref:Uncharacterized protein n=1 Tax=Candida theae TaxID=1198502 RepID=A0AAD5BJ32_9ASCO|nr:uncharacterized protein KGF57_000698 [Candida theae]KAI5965990.1 hypothetical protein KGF57_000698 [Candida theae]
MSDDEISSSKQGNERLRAKLEKLLKDNNADNLGFLNPLYGNHDSTVPSNLERLKDKYKLQLEEINKMESPLKVDQIRGKSSGVDRKKEEENSHANSFRKQASPKKEPIAQEEVKRLMVEVERLNKNVELLKKSLRDKEQEMSDLIEDYKDKERRIFKDQDFSITKLKKEYNHKIQNLQSKLDEKNENEVKLSQKCDRIKEESLIKDSIIQKLTSEIKQKEKDFGKLAADLTMQQQDENSVTNNNNQVDEELYHEQRVEYVDDEEFLKTKATLDAMEKRSEAKLKQDMARNVELFNNQSI